MLYYNPTLDRDCPSWVYLSWAIGLFLYQTFDAVDGMQAYVFPQTFEGVYADIGLMMQSQDKAEWSAWRVV
jgi:hypothetical protein